MGIETCEFHGHVADADHGSAQDQGQRDERRIYGQQDGSGNEGDADAGGGLDH